MKIKSAIVLGLACLIAVCTARPAEDYDYEEQQQPVAKPASRTNPLLNRRNPLSRGAVAKSTTTTTTAAPEAVAEEEIPEEELTEEEVPLETSSTTESARKLKGGIVRPFRSNQDLLATLKKRREQAVINKTQAKTTTQEGQESAPVAAESEKPAASSKGRATNGRGRYNKKETNAAHEEEPSSASTAAPARPSGRRFRN